MLRCLGIAGSREEAVAVCPCVRACEAEKRLGNRVAWNPRSKAPTCSLFRQNGAKRPHSTVTKPCHVG